MAGRIGRAFEAAAREQRGAFIPFLTSGFPDLVESDRLAAALCDEGADVLELGIPFSDPLADGPVIQRTSQQALAAGATPAHALGQALRLRARCETPIVLMTYLNPIVRYGIAAFAEDAAASGVDGMILVDLPPEEDPATWEALREAGLDTVTLIAPTTRAERFPEIASRASGFLYVVARLGVTGGGSNDPGLPETLRRCREHSPLPRCLGFGLDASSDFTRFRGLAEGVIVGSALLAGILEGADPAARESSARATARSVRERLRALAGP